MVRKDPADVLHLGAQDQVPQKNDHPRGPLHHVSGPQGDSREKIHDRSGEQRRQHKKEADRKGHTQDDRQGGEKGHRLFTPQLFVQPLLESGGFLLPRFILGVKLRRVHQGGDAGIHGGTEIDYSADKGPAQDGVSVLDELALLGLDFQSAVRTADHNGFFLGPQHHDPLDKGLPADHGAEGRGAGLRFFFRHSVWFSFAM